MNAIQRSLAWLRLHLRRGVDVGLHYDLRGEQELLRTEDGLPTMNFGYWRDLSPEPGSLGRANAALFRLVGEAAGLGPQAIDVLDVGCGFGTGTAWWLQNLGPQRIVGLNLSKFQLGRCASIAAERGLSDRARFVCGSATDMPFEDARFDRIVSVEAAFHFDLREDFLREAFRVLRPGGRLALTDIIVSPPTSLARRLQLAVLRRSVQIPEGNTYGLGAYGEKLAAAGFEVLELRSIRTEVLVPYFRWVLRQPLRRILAINPIFLLSSSTFFTYPWDYLLVSLRKPDAPPGPG